MPEYDFHTLSPFDFETLVCDLLREKLHIELETFGHGPDGGVDLRSTIGGSKLVVQCKHYRGSSFGDLKRAADKEKKNMDVISPDDYYFVTSQDLSITQKDTLLQSLSPHVSDSSRILARRDLNQILSDFPRVEANHFKLWMASAGIIRRIVQSGIWERSTALMEEIQDRVALYVSTASFSKAKEMLGGTRVCVITGAPGVGKSLLADMLALTHWEGGWQIVTLASHEVDKCWDAWDPEAKQLFYFDDVFGQTDIQERLSNDSGAIIARLVRRVSASERKRLVITTRTHILREAELRDEPVERSGLKARQCVVQVEDYKKMHRARILYNHLYFSNIPRAVIREFVIEGSHWKIIQHRNFTPRLIEQTILQEQNSRLSGSLAKRMLDALEHPVLLWGPSFREALTEPARMLLIHLASFPTSGAPMTELRAASIRGATPIEYRRAIAQLEGSWIRIEEGTRIVPGTFVGFHDPSCRDFVLAFLDSEPDYITEILRFSTDAVQIAQMLRYAGATGEVAAVKYPGINAAIVRSSHMLSELARAGWELGSSQQDFLATETLGSLLESSAMFGLGLEDWIADQVLRLGPVLAREPRVDADATAKLANLLISSGTTPSSPEQFESCGYIISSWCQYVSEDSEWDKVVAFIEWVEEFDQYRLQQDANFEALRDGFDSWLDTEFDAALDNSQNLEEAQAWVTSLEEVASRLFSWTEFDSSFSSFRERADQKWGVGYQPDDDDLLAQHAGLAVERSSMQYRPSASQPGAWQDDRRLDSDIRAMFEQLS